MASAFAYLLLAQTFVHAINAATQTRWLEPQESSEHDESIPLAAPNFAAPNHDGSHMLEASISTESAISDGRVKPSGAEASSTSAAPSVDAQLAGDEFSTSAPLYPLVCDPACSESSPCCASDSCSSGYPDAYPADGSCCFLWHGDCHKCCHDPPPPPPPAPVPVDKCCGGGFAREWPAASVPWNSWGSAPQSDMPRDCEPTGSVFGSHGYISSSFAKCCALMEPEYQQYGPHKAPPHASFSRMWRGVAQDPHCPAVCSPPSDPSVCKSGADACDDACDCDGCYGSSWSSSGGRASCSCVDSGGGSHTVCSV